MPNNGRARLIGAASAGHAYELTFADMNLANASHKKGMFTGTGDVNSRAQFLTRRGIGSLAKHRASDFYLDKFGPRKPLTSQDSETGRKAGQDVFRDFGGGKASFIFQSNGVI